MSGAQITDYWEHKYKVLQGKYNAETAGYRQAIMLADRRDEARKRTIDNVNEANDTLKKLVETQGQRVKMWRKQSGIFAFIICVLAVAVVTMWALLQRTEAKLKKALEPACVVEGEMYYADPEVVTAPPGTAVHEL